MTKVLNIDELVSEPLMKVVVGGKEHVMATPTMQNFLDNMKDLEAMSAAPNMVKETELTVAMIARAFPTLTEADILQWPASAIENLFMVIRGVDPDAQIEESDTEGNAPAAS